MSTTETAPATMTTGDGDVIAALRALLTEHQEIGRLQGNKLDDALRELGETQAKLRAAQAEIQRLHTMLHGRRPDA